MLRRARGFESVIAALSADARRHFDASRLTFEPLQRHDGPFSHVLRVRIVADGRAIHAYIKVFKPRDTSADELERVARFLKREYDATVALYSSLRTDPAIGALRPIAHLPEHLAIVTAEVPGRPFGTLLSDLRVSDERLLEVSRRIGRWVAAYQAIVPPASGRIELAERRAYVDQRLAQLDGRVIAGTDRRDILRAFDELASAIGDTSVPAAGIHADLNPNNVIVSDDGRVTVLDFTMAKTGTRLHDLSHLHFHMALRALRHPHQTEALEQVQSALLAGYSAELTARDPLFRLMWWQHAVCHLAFLAERPVRIAGPAYRWFLARRWRHVRALEPLATAA